MKKHLQDFINGIADIVYSPEISLKKSNSNLKKMI